MKSDEWCTINMEQQQRPNVAANNEQSQGFVTNAAATASDTAKGIIGTAGGVLGSAVSATGQAVGSVTKGVGEAITNLGKSTETTSQGASDHIYKMTGSEQHGKIGANEHVRALGSQ